MNKTEKELRYRTYYKPDIQTEDWPIYFYVNEDYEWQMDKDPEFKYDFYIPFFDDEWVIMREDIHGKWNIINVYGEGIR